MGAPDPPAAAPPSRACSHSPRGATAAACGQGPVALACGLRWPRGGAECCSWPAVARASPLRVGGGFRRAGPGVWRGAVRARACVCAGLASPARAVGGGGRRSTPTWAPPTSLRAARSHPTCSGPETQPPVAVRGPRVGPPRSAAFPRAARPGGEPDEAGWRWWTDRRDADGRVSEWKGLPSGMGVFSLLRASPGGERGRGVGGTAEGWLRPAGVLGVAGPPPRVGVVGSRGGFPGGPVVSRDFPFPGLVPARTHDPCRPSLLRASGPSSSPPPALPCPARTDGRPRRAFPPPTPPVLGPERGLTALWVLSLPWRRPRVKRRRTRRGEVGCFGTARTFVWVRVGAGQGSAGPCGGRALRWAVLRPCGVGRGWPLGPREGAEERASRRALGAAGPPPCRRARGGETPCRTPAADSRLGFRRGPLAVAPRPSSPAYRLPGGVARPRARRPWAAASLVVRVLSLSVLSPVRSVRPSPGPRPGAFRFPGPPRPLTVSAAARPPARGRRRVRARARRPPPPRPAPARSPERESGPGWPSWTGRRRRAAPGGAGPRARAPVRASASARRPAST